MNTEHFTSPGEAAYLTHRDMILKSDTRPWVSLPEGERLAWERAAGAAIDYQSETLDGIHSHNRYAHFSESMVLASAGASGGALIADGLCDAIGLPTRILNLPLPAVIGAGFGAAAALWIQWRRDQGTKKPSTKETV